MCGRYTLIPISDVQRKYDKPIADGYALNPLYNVAPGQYAPVVTKSRVEQMRWGLVPAWAKDVRVGYKMINARAETILERTAYRGLLKANRCLVPASGFYEWVTTPSGKQPYYFTVRDRQLVAFAGLYTERKDAEGYPLRSFTIITTMANKLVEEIHNRMPVILKNEDEARWLGDEPLGTGEALALLKPFSANQMDVYQVDRAVNKTALNSSELIRPV